MRIYILLSLIFLLQFASGQYRMSYTPETSMLSENNANCIAGEGDAVHVVWHDEFEDQIFAGVYYRRSLDNGLTWEDASWLGYGFNPSIAVQGNEVHIAFSAGRVFYGRSMDNGTSWNFIQLPDNHGDHPSLAVSGSQVHLVWHAGSGDYGKVEYCKSDDRGNTWSAIRTLSEDDEAKAKFPSIAANEARVHVVYQGENGLYYHRSDDTGDTWPGINVEWWSFFSRPSIAASGRFLVITCLGVDIATISSTDHGDTWDYGQYPIQDGSSGGIYSPHVAASGKIFFLSWNQLVNGTWSILTSYSNDGGVTWYPFPTVSPITGHFSCRPFALLKGKDIHLVATDNIFAGGKHEIFYLREENKLMELGKTYVGWGFSLGNEEREICNDIAVDQYGNVYATGYFEDEIDMDPGPSEWKLTSAGGTDMFVAKYDPNGHLLWARKIGASKHDSGASVCLDAQGNVYISGGFDGLVDFDPLGEGVFISSKGDQDIFLLRLNSEGQFMSCYAFGDEGKDYPDDIVLSNGGNIIFTGVFSGTVDFNRFGFFPLTSNGPSDIFLCILDGDGKFIHAQAIGGRQDASPSGLALDPFDNIYLAGTFRDTMDVIPGLGIRELISKGQSDAFILAVDSIGRYRWSGMLGSTGRDVGDDIAIDSYGHLILTGTYNGFFSIETDSMQVMLPWKDVYLAKLDLQGGIRWSRGVELDGNSSLQLATNALGQIYLAGSYRGVGSDQQTEYSYYVSEASDDVLLMKYNSDGEFLWLREYGGPGYSYLNAMAGNGVADLYIAGTYSEELYLDPGNLNVPLADPPGNQHDFYLAKIVECMPVYSSLTATACEVYVAPDGVTEWTSSGMYQQMIQTLHGCDSVITVDLTILESSEIAIEVVTCDAYTSPTGKTWSETGIYLDTLTNILGCDSILSFDLLVLGETQSVEYIESCESFQTPQGHVITSSGMVSDTFITQAGCDSILIYDVEIHAHQTNSYAITACHSYTTPDGLYTWDASGVYQYSLMTATGCDSSITVELEITPLDLSVSQSDTALTANLADATYQWVDCETGALIHGETSQTFITDVPGLYGAIIDWNGCTDTTACYATGLVRAEDQAETQSIQLFPNPVRDRIFFEYAGQCETMEIRLFDLLGRLQMEENISTCETLLLPPRIRSGMYYAVINLGGVTGVYKVVVE